MSEADADNSQGVERALVLKSQAGDRAAFEQLVRRSARGVFARLYLEVGDRDRAEDLVQETYLVAWRSIGQVTDPDGWRAWLASVSSSVRIDAGRREGRKKRSAARVDGEALGGVADQRDGPAENVQRAEARERVMGVLKEMPVEYREVLMLRYLSGCDYEAIGKQLGITNGSLRGLLNRGMVMLRERMGEGEKRQGDKVTR